MWAPYLLHTISCRYWKLKVTVMSIKLFILKIIPAKVTAVGISFFLFFSCWKYYLIRDQLMTCNKLEMFFYWSKGVNKGSHLFASKYICIWSLNPIVINWKAFFFNPFYNILIVSQSMFSTEVICFRKDLGKIIT